MFYQRLLFAPEVRVDVSFENTFEFRNDMYRDQRLYRGHWRPQKHFLGPDHVPAFDGAENGEEFQCAQAIDNLSDIRFWIKNIARHPASFWLPTATDKFYPDFVAKLKDERLLVVEYKGAHIADNLDTAEKRTIGELWERKSNGRGLFILVEKQVHGKDIRTQIQEKAKPSSHIKFAARRFLNVLPFSMGRFHHSKACLQALLALEPYS